MGFHLKKKHVIDRIFPFAVFFVFMVSSLWVSLLVANVYESTVNMENSNYESRTALSYIAEKIHQEDENGGISIGIFDGHVSLIIKKVYEEKSYFTYIYEEKGELRELFVQDGVQATAEDGRKIMKIHDLKMEEITDGVFRFSCVLEDGKEPGIVVTTLSK